MKTNFFVITAICATAIVFGALFAFPADTHAQVFTVDAGLYYGYNYDYGYNNNYVYDLLGQLTQDVSEGITNMNWRKGDRKLRQMTRSTNVTSFLYDPFGRRIAKVYKPAGTAETRRLQGGKESLEQAFYSSPLFTCSICTPQACPLVFHP